MQRFVNPTNLDTLLQTNALLTSQLNAKQKRIDYLEMVLAQRFEATIRTFDKAKIDEMVKKVLALWVEAPPGTGFNYEDAAAEFEHRWRFKSACVPQRMRDLRQEGKLWSKDIDGKVTFFLKLEGSL